MNKLLDNPNLIITVLSEHDIAYWVSVIRSLAALKIFDSGSLAAFSYQP